MGDNSWVLFVVALGVVIGLVAVSLRKQRRAAEGAASRPVLFDDAQTIEDSREAVSTPDEKPERTTKRHPGVLVPLLLIVSLAANGVLTGVVLNHRKLLDELATQKADRVDLNDVAYDTAELERELAAQEPFDASELKSRLSGVESDIRLMKGDIRFVNGSIDRVLDYLDTSGSGNSVEVSASDIRPPLFCSGGDIAIWDTFQGLTC